MWTKWTLLGCSYAAFGFAIPERKLAWASNRFLRPAPSFSADITVVKAHMLSWASHPMYCVMGRIIVQGLCGPCQDHRVS